jgi:glycosyltransferase involved in cell wall biosynthesis
MKKFLIKHVLISLDTGGAELLLFRLLKIQTKNTHFVHEVISLTDIGSVGYQLESLGIKVHSLKMKNLFDTPKIFFKLWILFIRDKPSIVQTWLYHSDLLGGFAARLAGVKNVIWGVHSTDIRYGDNLTTFYVRELCAKFSKLIPKSIVFVSNVSRKIHTDIGYSPINMLTISNGVNVSDFKSTHNFSAQLKTELNWAVDTLIIGIVARFNPDKDIENFIRAAAIVANNNQNAKFILVGRQLTLENHELMAHINETGASKKFALLGERSDVPLLMSSMDIFCLSSRTEAFPTVVCEAMASGIPCVVTDVGDTSMLIADTGIVVPKENSTALAGGLLKMLSFDKLTRDELGQKARKRISSEFTMKHCSEKYEALYRSLLKTKA